MGRIVQPKGTKGSLKWIQHVINECPDALTSPINKIIGGNFVQSIEWHSPKADDDYSEYRDQKSIYNFMGVPPLLYVANLHLTRKVFFSILHPQ